MDNTGQRNPLPTVDIVIEMEGGGIVLIERKFEPYGWALPGGFVDAFESLEDAAIREALEETSLEVELRCQMHAYSAPERDKRFHTISVVFVASARGAPVAADDALSAQVFMEEDVPEVLAFDHREILRDYFKWKRSGFKVFMK